MFWFNILGVAKKTLFNKYFLIGIIIAGLIAYHFFTVNGLKKDLKVTTENYNKIKTAYKINQESLKSLQKNLKELARDRETTVKSYIDEINKLRGIITHTEKKVIYKDRIVIKKVKVPVVKEGKTVYIEKCSDIKVKKMTKKDDNNSIIRILSNIGN